ncbi:MAG: putative DNA binding domain-containing protein [Clostridia bacterium]|nr:putative DNA binding domain-containing protein [Clostridia bacterium]
MAYIESEKLELKVQYTTEIKKEIVAFLNSDGGTLIIGVDDNGKIVGVENAKDIIERISLMIHEAIKPDASLICSAGEYEEDGKTIVRVVIGRGVKKPYYIYEKGLKPSGVYLRINNTSQQASEYAIKQMIIASEEKSFEALPSVQQDLTFDYLESVFKRAELELKQKTLGLLDANGSYTNLALLLSDQCPFSVKAAVFDSDDKSRFLDRKEFEGSLIRQADEIYEYLKLNNKTRGEYNGLRREDKTEYNQLVLREGLLNAITHRDYSLNGSILISIYKNRIEYVSIGGLVSGMTYADMMLGVSRSRNEKLANVFFKLKYVEAYGTGIEKIQGDYEHTGLEPRFEISDNGFLLVLPNKNYMEKAKEIRTDKELVYDFIVRCGRATRAQVQEELGFKLTKTRNILLQLEQEGKIERRGNGKGIFYTV